MGMPVKGLRGPVNWERHGSSTTATDANEAETEAKARAAATDGRAVRMEPIRDIQRLPNAPRRLRDVRRDRPAPVRGLW